MIKDLSKHWEAIEMMMDDAIRERVAFELAPCTNEEFFKALLRACTGLPERFGYRILKEDKKMRSIESVVDNYMIKDYGYLVNEYACVRGIIEHIRVLKQFDADLYKNNKEVFDKELAKLDIKSENLLNELEQLINKEPV